MSIATAKKALRASVSKALRDLGQLELQSQSDAIVTRLVAHDAFKRAKTISCYLSMPAGEVQTTALISNVLSHDGRRLFVPSLAASKDGQMDFVRLYNEEDLRTLPAGLWGIPEPGAQWVNGRRQNVLDDSCENLDLIVMPGVAFDASLSRLGHGKGYYDRFISSYVGAAKRPRPLLVALSLQQQLLEAGKVPVTDRDWKVDMIVTPNDIITCENFE